MYIDTFFLLRMADTITSQNIGLSSWITLYTYHCRESSSDAVGLDNIQRWMMGLLISGELENIWNEAVMALFRYYSDWCFEGLSKTTTYLSGYAMTGPRFERNTSIILDLCL
jgi:hypothetical protein